ncbi:hypothetical protein MSG28_010273 [Choristoneura fumiferana]|uniref:Uncharacterized protein n=1 Tax=Choristoneura fumiferana TaxID=7141 RepID=A0ACC0KJZ7_CHOFU|nr:hypothetical protein MSG28_010273 [Choristoneura fumiferana]
MSEPNNPFAGLLGVSETKATNNSNYVDPNTPLSVNTKKSQEDEEVETINNIVENVFYFTINANAFEGHRSSDGQLVYLEELAEAMKPRIHIDLEALEQALFERLLLPDVELNVIPKTNKILKEHVVQKQVFSYLFSSIQNLQNYEHQSSIVVKNGVHKMRELIFRNAVTALKQPALFEGQDFASQLVELLKNVDPQSEEGVQEQLRDTMIPVLLKIHTDINKSNLINLPIYILPSIHIFASNPSLAQILMETCEPKNETNGRFYQDSVLGALLSLSVLSRTNASLHEFFDNPMDQAAVSMMETSLHNASSHLTNNLHKIFLTLLKGGPQMRNRILTWIDCLHSETSLLPAKEDENGQALKRPSADTYNFVTEFVSLRCALLQSEMLANLNRLQAMTCTWLVQVAVRPDAGVQSSYAPGALVPVQMPVTTPPPDTLRCVPEFVLENIVVLITMARRTVGASSEEADVAGLLHPALTLVLTFMGDSTRTYNPHLRARLAECLEAMLPNHPDDQQPLSSLASFYREQLFKEHPHRLELVPCLLDVFVGIEMTGQSVQFEQKFNYRRPMESGAWANLSPQERDQNISNLTHTGMLARFDNILGRDTVHTLVRLSAHAPFVFCHPTLVERIASMLNYFLLHLVGPTQKNLKVKDMKEFEFDPASTVLDICRMYVELSSSEQVARRVARLAEQRQRDEEILANAPEEFLDPIMSTLMRDPVLLPSSRTTVDRITIARHLLSDQTDPFNRSPLSMDQVKSNTELKERIEAWIAEQKQKIAQPQTSRVRKQSDCPVGKQGPMRATLPVSSVMKSGGLKKSTANSPTLSPTNVWRRISPDHALSGSRFGTGGVPLRAARSSVEGLNQEIERLVLYPASGTQTPHLDRLKDKVTPEGHRAPLAELLRRSVNTQTPHDLCHTAHSSGGSVCSSPDLDGAKLGTSPQINRFLAREPPDGCEKDYPHRIKIPMEFRRQCSPIDEKLLEVYSTAWEIDSYFHVDSTAYLFSEVGLNPI